MFFTSNLNCTTSWSHDGWLFFGSVGRDGHHFDPDSLWFMPVTTFVQESGFQNLELVENAEQISVLLV